MSPPLRFLPWSKIVECIESAGPWPVGTPQEARLRLLVGQLAVVAAAVLVELGSFRYRRRQRIQPLTPFLLCLGLDVAPMS